MESVLLVIHLMIALSIIVVILLQRSEGGGLGIGSGGGGMGNLATARSTASFLTRLTGILAIGFMTTSLLLAIVASNSTNSKSILDTTTPGAIEKSVEEKIVIEEAPVAPIAE